MSYVLYIDDERTPPESAMVLARTLLEAKEIVKKLGLPSLMSLDHDLGGDDTVMHFLHWLAENYYEEGPPEYSIHSANPVGRQNMDSFLKSWKKSLTKS